MTGIVDGLVSQGRADLQRALEACAGDGVADGFGARDRHCAPWVGGRRGSIRSSGFRMPHRASWVGDTRWSGRGSLQGQHDSSMECCVCMRAGVTDLVVRPLSVMRGRVCVGASGSHSWLGASNYAQFSEQPGIQDICA
jgi:hypothetical protein